jgi:hypothetical protein
VLGFYGIIAQRPPNVVRAITASPNASIARPKMKFLERVPHRFGIEQELALWRRD